MEPSDSCSSHVDPLARHRQKTEAVLRDGDEAAIKNLYVELGEDLWQARIHGGGADIPVLSRPETLTAVLDGLRGTYGLILDAGCGPNPAAAIALMKRGSTSVVGLDLGWAMVRTARAIATDRGVDLLGVAGDVERLPFRTGVFDGVVCDDTIEHLPDERAAIRELSRVIASRGLAILATPNRHSAAVLRARLKDWRAGIRRSRRDYFVASSHLREYTWSEFERVVRDGFSVHHKRAVGWQTSRQKRALSHLLGLPGLGRVSQVIVLECRRR